MSWRVNLEIPRTIFYSSEAAVAMADDMMDDATIIAGLMHDILEDTGSYLWRDVRNVWWRNCKSGRWKYKT